MKTSIIRSREEIELAYKKLSGAQEIGCDTETSSLSPRGGKLFSIQFSDGEESFLLPLSEKIEPGKLTEILLNQNIVKIFHNAKFDLEFLRENGLMVENVFCTMIAEKILTKGANQSVSLAETLYRYFAVDLDKSQRTKFSKNWDGIWTEELVNYALADVFYLPKLKHQQEKWMERLGLIDNFRNQMEKLR